MKKRNECDFYKPEKTIENMDVVKSTVVKLHNKDKSDVLKYLDALKEENKIGKEATYDNDFLKYMF